MTNLLSSWKEIAGFMGKGVRTVQRWEKQLALPVHRPAGGLRHVVFAKTDELMAWMSSDRARLADEPRTVLLLGNDADLRNGVRCGLEDAGYVVVRCGNASEASFVSRLRPNIDLLLVGREVDQACLKFAQELVANDPTLRSVVVDSSEVARKLGSNCIALRRPITTETLLRKLDDTDIQIADAA